MSLPPLILQAFNGMSSQRLGSLECDMEFVSGTARLAVRGSGPFGKFSATVTNFSVKGKSEALSRCQAAASRAAEAAVPSRLHTGTMRVIPVPSERMLLWSFKQPPEANFKLQVAVAGGGGGRKR